MSKKWVDANKISMIHELPNKNLRDIDYEMRKKPNFDKNSNSKKVKVKKKK